MRKIIAYLLKMRKKKVYSVDEGLCMKKGLITVKEAATILKVDIQTIRRWDTKGKLKAFRHPMNNYRLYKKTTIQKLAERINFNEE